MLSGGLIEWEVVFEDNVNELTGWGGVNHALYAL